MAFAHTVVRCTAFGTAFGGAEEWSTGFYMGVTNANTLDPTQLGADYLLDEWTTLFTSATVDISGYYTLDGVRVAKLNTDGSTDLANNYYSYPTGSVVGGGGLSAYPGQCSIVCSLRADPDRGLGAKGRMYLPGINKLIGSNGKISVGSADDISLGMKTFFDNINASFDLTGSVINASKGRTLPVPAAGVNRIVTSIKIGDVYDTQRRRRNSLTEVYSNRAIVA